MVCYNAKDRMKLSEIKESKWLKGKIYKPADLKIAMSKVLGDAKPKSVAF